MISKEFVICPFCKKTHNKHKAIGTSGLINYAGSERGITCEKCGKEFVCVYEVEIRYKTSKY